MKTPAFWSGDHLVSRLLIPFSYIYGAVTQWRLKRHEPYKCGAYVVCVGNITAGGVGKTPVALALAEKYIREGKKVFL